MNVVYEVVRNCKCYNRPQAIESRGAGDLYTGSIEPMEGGNCQGKLECLLFPVLPAFDYSQAKQTFKSSIKYIEGDLVQVLEDCEEEGRHF